jgi:hypothetical protein
MTKFKTRSFSAACWRTSPAINSRYPRRKKKSQNNQKPSALDFNWNTRSKDCATGSAYPQILLKALWTTSGQPAQTLDGKAKSALCRTSGKRLLSGQTTSIQSKPGLNYQSSRLPRQSMQINAH